MSTDRVLFSAFSNLVRDCIPINQTTELLPLNLIFKQIDRSKLRDYLKQSDFEEYLRRSNRPNVEFIRENLIASDFEMTGLLHVDHFWWTMAAVLLVKEFLFVGFGNLKKPFVIQILCKQNLTFFLFSRTHSLESKERRGKQRQKL